MIISNDEEITPQAGDYWEFKLPGKRKRIKEVGRVDPKDFIVERGTYPEWKDTVERVPYVFWARLNGGRYTGITVKRLMEFGRRVSTKVEREAHFAEIVANAKRRRAEKHTSGDKDL